jgi:hypothetical protein
MPKIPAQTLREVEQALEQYIAAVNASRLTPQSKKTYLLHGKNFVRWLNNDFEPGGTLP